MWRVDFGLITACLTRCRYYRCACIWLSNPIFWQRNLSSLKWDQITQSAGNCWTKIKLRSAANHAIYLVIFHWVVGSLYLNWYINFTTVGFLVCTEERSVSLYACKFDCFNWTKWGDISYAVPLNKLQSGGPVLLRPSPPPLSSSDRCQCWSASSTDIADIGSISALIGNFDVYRRIMPDIMPMSARRQCQAKSSAITPACRHWPVGDPISVLVGI